MRPRGENQARWNLRFFITVMACVVAANFNVAQADETVEKSLADAYAKEIQPLLSQFCYDCHSQDLAEADVDLSRFENAAAVRMDIKTWLKVRLMLKTGQMPPPDSPQPTDEDQQRLQKWVRDFLTLQANAHAGDPGPIVLRRLNNAEYNYTIRDLTGVSSLDPTQEFPVDGAAGEGFTNTGSAQAMSPSLVSKYLDAAKEVAAHTMFLPDGIHFSPHTTRRDQTDELVARIQDFYRRHSDETSGMAIGWQGVKFDEHMQGRLDIKKYLHATLEERESLRAGRKTLETVAKERTLNPRYLGALWNALTGPKKESESFLLAQFRRQWNETIPADIDKLTAEIAQMQEAYWKFNAVGQLGEGAVPKTWMEAVTPVLTQQELRQKLPEADTDAVIYLSAHDLGDGRDHDFVLWEQPRLQFPADESGRTPPAILLREVRNLVPRVEKTLAQELPRTTEYLLTLAKSRTDAAANPETEAGGLNSALLTRWAELTGLGESSQREIKGHYKNKITSVQGYSAINGWGEPATPSLLTNRSEEDVQVSTLKIPARGVVTHPSPTQDAIVAWKSPVESKLRIEGTVADVDGNCGNGFSWRVEWNSAAGKAVLASGVVDNGGHHTFQVEQEIAARPGEVISLIIGPRDGNHVCDTTHVALKLTEVGGEQRMWDLASDIIDKIHEGNPLRDGYGHEATWHFCSLASQPQEKPQLIPGSALAQWRAAVIDKKPAEEIQNLSERVQAIGASEDPATLSEADRKLHDTLTAWNGPLHWASIAADVAVEDSNSTYGFDPSEFGHHPDGSPVDPNSLCVQAPDILEIRLPAALARGAEFVVTGRLHEKAGAEGSVQLQILSQRQEAIPLSTTAPVIARENSAAHKRVQKAMADIRDLFPPALCYSRIVPVDEVVTMTLFFREDEYLQRLMLDEQQRAELDRLWDELLYVAQEPIALTVSFEQIYEFATQDRPDLVKAFGPMRESINARGDKFRERLIQTEPAHVQGVLEFTERAWRRPVTEEEQAELKQLYAELRKSDIPHEAAIRLTIARVLTAPAFLYRLEQPVPGSQPGPVTANELANRLSYFLWSSLPDAELRAAADSGALTDDKVLRGQTERMLADPRTRRLAIQFACQWLHLRNFDQNDDKNEQLYPEFAELRDDMYEETVRFFEEMFRGNGSILDLLNADHTYLNASLAQHYGIEGVTGEEWRKIDGVKARGRGGVLGMATFLASQSGASRTSPILRGNWVYETLLGERLPRPPANVPQLPEAVPEGLSARQLIEQHSSVPACAKCHARIDPMGFALEQYDAIGRLRPEAADTKTTLPGGQEMIGIDGLRKYLAEDRREDVVRQFCRKLLGYALGREIQLSDEPLLSEMQQRLKAEDYRFHIAVESIVGSRQFRQIRGTDFVDE